MNKLYKSKHHAKVSETNRKYHEKNREKITETKRKRKALYDSVVTAVRKFKAAVREGTYYICVICNRCFFKRSVKCFHVGKYTLPDKPFFYIAHKDSFGGKEYIGISA